MIQHHNCKFYFQQSKNFGNNIQLFRYSEYTNNSDLIFTANLQHVGEAIDNLQSEYNPKSFIDSLHKEYKQFSNKNNGTI